MDEAVFVVLVCGVAAAITLSAVVWSTALGTRPPPAQRVRIRRRSSSE